MSESVNVMWVFMFIYVGVRMTPNILAHRRTNCSDIDKSCPIREIQKLRYWDTRTCLRESYSVDSENGNAKIHMQLPDVMTHMDSNGYD